jgi:hypothetical protein
MQWPSEKGQNVTVKDSTTSGLIIAFILEGF